MLFCTTVSVFCEIYTLRMRVVAHAAILWVECVLCRRPKLGLLYLSPSISTNTAQSMMCDACCTVEVWEWISNFIPYFTCWACDLSMLGFKSMITFLKRFCHQMANKNGTCEFYISWFLQQPVITVTKRFKFKTTRSSYTILISTTNQLIQLL